MTWTGVTLRAALVNLTSAAKDYVGILGVGSYGRVGWTNVLVAVTLTNVTSTVGNYVGIVGAASNSGVAGVNVAVAADLLWVTRPRWTTSESSALGAAMNLRCGRM